MSSIKFTFIGAEMMGEYMMKKEFPYNKKKINKLQRRVRTLAGIQTISSGSSFFVHK
jgi:hypothetical protein